VKCELQNSTREARVYTYRPDDNGRNNLLECTLLKQIEFLNLFEFIYKLIVNDDLCKPKNTFNDISQLLQVLNILHFVLYTLHFAFCTP
jgi:hypothetical protein